MSKEAALFSIFVLAFLGAEIVYLQSHVLNVVNGHVDPGAGFGVWLAFAFVSSCVGFVGAYRILRSGRFNNAVMSVFLFLLCINLDTPGWMASPWVVSFNLGFTVSGYGLGVNTVGIVLLSTYRGLVRFFDNRDRLENATDPDPIEETERHRASDEATA